MLISLCIPCHKRLDSLRQTMPKHISVANMSPPVEVVVVDYNSGDGLSTYLETVRNAFFGGSYLTPVHYTGRSYYHMAHARNLSVKAASGAYIVILSADIWLEPDYLPLVRELIRGERYTWLRQAHKYRGVICLKRAEFIACGGYDERFEFYGPEDRDLEERLIRRSGKAYHLPDGLVNVIRTPDDLKVKNYRLPLTKDEMSARMRPIYNENTFRKVLTVNSDKEWGVL